ncbi:hypothetical protein CHGG_06934 [Chaetomium globosum CBS 148.51]|uniref:Nicotianamine synthase n=1 Tax=Chaetomium globosum (strain ATCC 6205 / CBS 148.51 / DSM 1962 / NBRC 6347 / NRRL 1970) TaxID=306901 RepID=Q2GYM0_CHAGB|nr:uncharacterized protein CHGG_06934 [Chaetomium globosum CBS 148.51]EAQ85681.1 hypothetical protein CHGG_06934 [Chaetomium globosum CBS 148.51]
MEPCPCASHDSLAIVEKADILHDQLADARTEKVQWLVRTIVETHSDLLKLPHFRPGNAINKLLGNLVSVCSEIHDREVVDRVLSHARVQAVLPSLRQICAQAESCLELHWAEHILSTKGTPDEVLARLKTFPYYENYQDLTRLELCSILSATKTTPRHVAFIGSGPLPLTSLCLLQALKQDALAGRGMEFICAEATAADKDLAEFDVVYLAALVGITQAEKERIVLQVVDRMRPGALLVVRSSWGLRTCLYPEVDLATEGLLKRLECCVVVHPYGQVVNSVIVARVRG